jgi:hypothetical protein
MGASISLKTMQSKTFPKTSSGPTTVMALLDKELVKDLIAISGRPGNKDNLA